MIFKPTSTATQLDPAPLPRLPLSKSNPFGLAAKAAEAACTSVICQSSTTLWYVTLPKFNSSPLKNGGWKTTFLLGR